VFAVTNSNGTSTVTVSNNGKQKTRTVTTGLTSGGMVEITSGLRAGEQVVLSRPGARFGAGGTNAVNGSTDAKQGAAGNG
jgi:multidrug efflux pump subunit AcrA (membrane-fusion protein)